MYKIFIGNVDFRTTEEQLRELFEPHITIEDLVIARDPETGKSKGYGFALTPDPEAGRQAIRKIGKVRIDGRLVYLKEAHGKKKKTKKKGGKSSRGFGRRPIRGRPRPGRGGRGGSGGGGPAQRSQGYSGGESGPRGPGGYSSGYSGPSEDPSSPDSDRGNE